MTSRRARAINPARTGLRVPPAVVRVGVAQFGRRVLNPDLPWEVQRKRLGGSDAAAPLPRGSTVTKQQINRTHVEIITARESTDTPVVVHFHGGGYCVGSPGTARAWAARLSAAAGCRVMLPDYRLAPEHPHPAALDDARAVMDTVLGQVGPGSVV